MPFGIQGITAGRFAGLIAQKGMITSPMPFGIQGITAVPMGLRYTTPVRMSPMPFGIQGITATTQLVEPAPRPHVSNAFRHSGHHCRTIADFEGNFRAVLSPMPFGIQGITAPPSGCLTGLKRSSRLQCLSAFRASLP